jgi:hypothetical protein
MLTIRSEPGANVKPDVGASDTTDDRNSLTTGDAVPITEKGNR